jgi:hypothetical protein
MYSRIRYENFWDPDAGSGMKNLGIRIRDKTSRIRNSGSEVIKTVLCDQNLIAKKLHYFYLVTKISVKIFICFFYNFFFGLGRDL